MERGSDRRGEMSSGRKKTAQRSVSFSLIRVPSHVCAESYRNSDFTSARLLYSVIYSGAYITRYISGICSSTSGRRRRLAFSPCESSQIFMARPELRSPSTRRSRGFVSTRILEYVCAFLRERVLNEQPLLEIAREVARIRIWDRERIVTVYSVLQIRVLRRIEFIRFLIIVRERLLRSTIFDEGMCSFLFHLFEEDIFILRTKC